MVSQSGLTMTATRRAHSNRDWEFCKRVSRPGDRIVVATWGREFPDLVYEIQEDGSMIGPVRNET